MERFENVTLFHEGMFGFNKVECRWVEVEVRPYAQYAEAVHVRFVEKGKRKVHGFVCAGLDGHFAILAGYGHPSLGPSAFVRKDEVSTVSRWASCDPRWAMGFVWHLTNYSEETGAKVLANHVVVRRQDADSPWMRAEAARRVA